jgi:hypothetical protein
MFWGEKSLFEFGKNLCQNPLLNRKDFAIIFLSPSHENFGLLSVGAALL